MRFQLTVYTVDKTERRLLGETSKHKRSSRSECLALIDAAAAAAACFTVSLLLLLQPLYHLSHPSAIV